MKGPINYDTHHEFLRTFCPVSKPIIQRKLNEKLYILYGCMIQNTIVIHTFYFCMIIDCICIQYVE